MFQERWDPSQPAPAGYAAGTAGQRGPAWPGQMIQGKQPLAEGSVTREVGFNIARYVGSIAAARHQLQAPLRPDKGLEGTSRKDG